MKSWFTFLTHSIALLLAGFAATGVGLHAQTVSTFATGFNGPSALAFDAAGNLYVANAGNNTVSKVTPGGGVTQFANGFSYPMGLAFDAAGNLYVANYLGNTVSKVPPGGGGSTFASGFNGPVGLAFDAAGNLYVANRNGGTVSKVTSGGSVTVFASGLTSPYALAFDTAGNLYVSSSATTVSKIPSGGGAPTAFATAPYEVYGMVLDTAGNLYLVSRDPGVVSKVTPGGSISTVVSGLSYTDALARDAAGDLYVASDTSGVVSKITLPTPTITSLSPTSGATVGGTSVVITGTNFTDVTAVNFGATAAASYTLDNATQITATSPGTSAGTVHITVTNGYGTSATSAADQFTFVNAAPVVGNLGGDSVTFTEDGSAVLLDAGSNATVTDTDSANFSGGNVTVSIVANRVSGEDVLAIRNQGTGAGQIGVSGGNVTYAGTTIGTLAGGSGTSDLVVTLNANSTPANVGALLLNLTYHNTNTGAPSTSARTVRVTVNDGAGGTSAAADVTVNITAVNDAPSASGLPTDLTVLEDALSTFNLSAVTLADPDAGAGSLTLTLTASAGMLSATSGGGVTIGGNGTGTLTLTGTLAALNTFLDTVTNILYTGAANANGDNAATVTVKLNDGGNTGTGGALEATLGTINVDITAVNDAPTLAAIGDPAAILEDAGQQTVALSGISAGPGETQALNVTASSGNPGLIPNPAVTYTSANATGSLSYTPVANANGSAVITVTVTDDGGTANGGVATFSRTFTVNVTAVNDAPTNVSLSSLTLNQSAGVNGVVGTLSAADVDGGDTFTFSLVAGTGDTDNASFNISGTSLRANNAGSLAAGTHAVRVQVDDGHGGTFAKSFAITVIDDVAPATPAVPDLDAASDTGVSSTDNKTTATTLTFTGTAEAGSTVTLYDTDGTTVLGTATATGGNWSIMASGLAAGSHTVTAKAKDAANNVSAASGGLSVTIDTTAPTVSSVSVPGSATYVSGQNLDLTVNWTEAVTVDTAGGTPSIALTIGSTSRSAAYQAGSGTSALVFRYTTQSGDLDIDGIAVGALSLNSGTIEDTAGNNATLTLNSVGSTVGVLVDAVAPTVTGRTVPSDGTYKAGQNLDFTVSYSENVTVNTGGGTPYIAVTLDTGGTVQAAYNGGTGTSTLTFRYTIASGNLDTDGVAVASSITLNGGTIKDGTGNDAATTSLGFAATTGVLVDGEAPTVSSINRQTPSGTSTNATSVVFRVTFAEAVTGVDTADFTLTKTSTADGAISSINAVSGTVYDVTVNTITGNGTLRLDLNAAATGIADAATNAIATGYTAGQAYTIDTTAPTVQTSVRQSPTTVNSDAASVTWRVTFSEDVTGVDAADFTLTAGTGSPSGTVSSVSSAGDAKTYDVVVTPSGQGGLRLDLKSSGTGIADTAGNAIADGGFTAGDFYVVGVTSVFDTSGVTPNGFVVVAGGGTKAAQRFTTAAGQPLTLTTVTALLKTITGTPSPVVQILANNSGAPGATVVATLTNPASLTANALNVWTGSVSLSASTTYWVAFSDTSGAASYEIRLSTVATSGGTGAWLTSPTDYKFYYGANLENSADSVLKVALGATSVPSITSTLTASATYRTAFNYQIAATNTPTSYAATGLPTGLSVNTSTGAITGSPTQTGSFNVSLTATNGSGTGSASTLVLTVAKASLTVTAADATRQYGASNPSFSVNYSGLLGGDTPAGLTTAPAATSAATASSPAGTYTISASGGVSDNYSFTYVSGTLTVTAATQTITFGAIGNVVMGQSVSLTASASSGLPVTFAVVSGPATVSGATVTTTGPGVVTVQATQAGNGNYDAASASQSFEAIVGSPTVTTPEQVPVPPAGGTATLVVGESNPNLDYQWQRNGTNVVGATGTSLTLPNVEPPVAGLYTYTATVPGGGSGTSEPVIVGLSTTEKVIGTGEVVGADIVHPNGNVYDQVLLEGKGATLTASTKKVTRISFVDLSNDIVQVEFSGAGSVSVVMDDAGTRAPAENYNQAGVDYVKGHAGLVITGADETSNVSVFSVGRYNAVNQSLFRDNVTYDGVADIAFIAIQSKNGKFGGIRTGNVSYFASSGFTGIYAPGVEIVGPVNVGNIEAYDAAQPVFVVGSAGATRITGGDLYQPNGAAVEVKGLSRLEFVVGTTSQGAVLPAQHNRAVLKQDGVDVTDLIVVNP